MSDRDRIALQGAYVRRASARPPEGRVAVLLPGLGAVATTTIAGEMRVPVAGKDFKTGQTLLKTALAPALRARRLGVRGWFSTNILGNRDGEVLDDPDAFRSKEISKTGVLDNLLSVDDDARLYGAVCHKVRIDYYPPR